jgi:hypothetical protein
MEQINNEETVLSDIEIQREKQRFEELNSSLRRSFGAMWQRYRIAFSYLIRTGAFTEKDLQQMMRGQVLSPEFSIRPCQAIADKDGLDDVNEVERRRYQQGRFGEPLRPVPVARHRLECPLHERGRKGDPLVPCYFAQRANPKYPRGKRDGALALPPDLPEEQREMIEFFCDPQIELEPCRVLQVLCQHDLSSQLQSGELLQIRPRPVPPAPQPAPELREDLGLRRLLQVRQAALEEAARLDAAAEQHRRDLLRHLIETGRLTNGDLIDMTYNVIMVTDEGWLPCRDDPQRTWVEEVDVDGKADEREDEDPAPQRFKCPLQVRAMEGDTTVPCCEAQQVAPSPERIAQVAEREARLTREYEEFWRKRGGPPQREAGPEPHYFAGPADAPGGPQDIVRLLHIRPCFLLGRTAATSLYQYGEFLVAHPELLDEQQE